MKVAVVGLGIAGLRAAMLLEQRGHEVELFEGRDRVGGRMRTVTQAAGAVYEAGGEWIDADHFRTLSLLREMSVEIESCRAVSRRLRYRGEECTEATLWADALEDQIRLDSSAQALCRSLKRPVTSNVDRSELDQKTLADLLRENSRSERGLWWLRAQALSDEGDDPEQIGLLGWLGFYANYLDREGSEMSAHRIRFGSTRLFDAMLHRLKSVPQLKSVLQRISLNPKGLSLTFDSGEASADAAILTMPPPLLEELVFDPALSAEKRCAIEAAKMGRAIKVVLQFESPWWLAIGWDGSMQADELFQQTWDAGIGPAATLTSYVCGEAADKLRNSDDPVGQILSAIAKVHPEAQRKFQAGWLHDWISDPFSKGAFSYLPPGYVLEHLPHLARPARAISFAGEHTSEWTGFIEGALESAERAVEEVCALV